MQGVVFAANLTRYLPVKKFVNRLKLDKIMATSLWTHFNGSPCTSTAIDVTQRNYNDIIMNKSTALND